MTPTIVTAAEHLPHPQPTAHEPAVPTSASMRGGSWSRHAGLNAANFFIAAAGGVMLPFTAAFLGKPLTGKAIFGAGLVVASVLVLAF